MATAALTNVALLLVLYPEVLPMIEIVLMGGCLGVGNTGAWGVGVSVSLSGWAGGLRL